MAARLTKLTEQPAPHTISMRHESPDDALQAARRPGVSWACKVARPQDVGAKFTNQSNTPKAVFGKHLPKKSGPEWVVIVLVVLGLWSAVRAEEAGCGESLTTGMRDASWCFHLLGA